MPNRSLFCDKRSMLLSKIGVCFLKIGVCFFETRSLFFWKSGFDFCKSEFVFFSKSEFVFWKSEYFPPDSELPFCSWVRTKSLTDPGKGAGNLPPPRPRLYFWTKLRPEGPKKNFLETIPLLISGSGWPPSLLSEGLYSSFRSHMEISDLEDLFKSSKLRIPAFNY